MAMIVKNNMGAVKTLNTLNKNSKALSKSLAKVSSGMKITGAADDASGYSISENMRVRIRALSQADQNTQTGTSLLQVAEGAIQNQIDILRTIKAKVLDANNDTNTDIDRAIIQKEIDQGFTQMEEITYTTNYNGRLLLCGTKGMSWELNTWEELDNAEFAVFENPTQDFGLITGTVTDTKGITDRTFQTALGQDMNLQPGLGATDQGITDSVYDTAAVYHTGGATLRTTTGTVGSSVPMSGGTNWVPQTSTLALDTTGTVAGLLSSLDGQSVRVDVIDGGSTLSETFTFYDSSVGGSGGANDIDLAAFSGLATTANAATSILSALMNKIVSIYDSNYGTYNIVEDGSGTAWEHLVYGKSISNTGTSSVLTMQSGEFDFTVTTGAPFTCINSVTVQQDEASAYCDIDLDDFLTDPSTGSAFTDVEDLIDQFLFKFGDDELTTDVDTSDDGTLDTGNNLVVDKSFTFASPDGLRTITYEFIDTGRDSTGTDYLYDEQKILGSQLCDLNTLRNYAASYGGDLKRALAQFLYDSINYTSYGRNASYTRELLDSSGNVTTASSAESIRFYAYQPYAGSDSYAAGATTPYYMSHSHYESGRFIGRGVNGNLENMTTGETYLSSYDLDLKAWWEDNIGDPTLPGDENTASALAGRLNGRGFRFYCANSESNSRDESDYKEWINIYFTDHSIEDRLEEERPTAGNNMTTGETLDTIVVDVRNIKNYKELVRAVYKQANLASAGGQAANTSQVGFEENPITNSVGNSITDARTEYFNSSPSWRVGEPQHFMFAMDEEKGILTIWDTDRHAHSQEMLVSDGVYDNIRLSHRDILEDRLIIHDTDKSSQAIVIHIPRTTMDQVFGYQAGKHDISEYNVMTKEMRTKLLGASKNQTGILDKGLDYLTNANTLLGAQINRLAMSHANLVTSVENVTGSESTIRDADMAKEMTAYTKHNVLTQAAQSMLAQANQNASSVLSLLQ